LGPSRTRTRRSSADKEFVVFVVYAVVAVLVAAVLLASAGAKRTRQEAVVTSLTGIVVPLEWFPQVAALEIAGTIGWWPGCGSRPSGWPPRSR
jgi:uncharacterized membrane protein